ncbi:PiggyBac transposable element-derived protein 3-like [Elysia marginata]|uniref:PiggyBac transposable element-derived protein 3-like n=1 Tax=Elysia marginata TaxID=1093978 RepID=A0AAV4J0X0_9GAST|nr:PiggyBac transposable element-derived protein 3-like [Elysia marginata]
MGTLMIPPTVCQAPEEQSLACHAPRRGPQNKQFRWRTVDIKPNEQLQWEPEQPDVSQLPKSVTELFELFYDDAVIDLLSRLACNGAIRANCTSDFPLVDIKQLEKQHRGTYDHKSDNSKGVVMARWNDNRVVTVMSNLYRVEPIQSASRWSQKDSKRINIPQPYAIQKYNRTMVGSEVDRLDQKVGFGPRSGGGH